MRPLLDVMFPPQCLSCGDLVQDAGVCSACWSKITFISEPVCYACGTPFDFDHGGETLCGACLKARPVFERAGAAFVYDGHSRNLVLALKHADRLETAQTLARWAAQAGAVLLRECDVIVPVPLHWSRLFKRRYNQSALLARALGDQSGKAVLPDVLLRSRRTPSLGHKSPAERGRLLIGAFTVSEKGRQVVENKKILLIDDVYTSGATARSCTRALLKAGAASVDVLTCARVVRPVLI